MSQPLHLTTADFDQTMQNAGDKPVLVDFYADWCGPCKMAAPIIDQLAQEYEGKAVIAKVDTDAQGELAQKFGVMSIPTMIVFVHGQEVDRQVGFSGKQGIMSLIDSAQNK